MFQQVQPVLAVRDVARAIAYYVDRLGFQLAFRSDDGRYVGIRRDGVDLHLQWHDEVDFVGVEAGSLMLRMVVDDPDALFEEYRDKGVFHDRTQLRDTVWGTREFGVFDLDGHGLVFYRGL